MRIDAAGLDQGAESPWLSFYFFPGKFSLTGLEATTRGYKTDGQLLILFTFWSIQFSSIGIDK